MKELLLLLLSPLLCLSAPQLGFGDATEAEIAEIRSGNYLEDFEENPSYNYNYRIADDRQQTYIAMEEERQDGLVTGSYSYVDPTGALVVVNYQAGPQGYSETREVSHNFVTIRAKPVRTVADDQHNALAVQEAKRVQEQRRQQQRLQQQRLQEQRQQEQRQQEQKLKEQRRQQHLVDKQHLAAAGAETNSVSQSDIVAQILAQLQPLVSHTIASAVKTPGQATSTATSDVSGASTFSTSGGSPISRLPVPESSLPVIDLPANTQVISFPSTSLPAIDFPLPALDSPSETSDDVSGDISDTSGVSDVSGVFGSGGVTNVKFYTPNFRIEY